MISQKQTSKVFVLEEVLAKVVVLGLGQDLNPLRHPVLPRLRELHPHLQLLFNEGRLVILIFIQLHLERILRSVLEI